MAESGWVGDEGSFMTSSVWRKGRAWGGASPPSSLGGFSYEGSLSPQQQLGGDEALTFGRGGIRDIEDCLAAFLDRLASQNRSRSSANWLPLIRTS